MNLSSQKFRFIIGLLLLIFLLLRVPGLHATYHQDEVKWVVHSTTPGDTDTGKGQPPLSGIIFPWAGKHLGADNMRLLPLLFGLLNFWLLYWLVKTLFDKTTALWAVGLFSVCFYSVLASLMVDIDGQFLPSFVLLTFLAFFQWQRAATAQARWVWGFALGASLLLGFMAKLNFVIPALALLAYYLSDKGWLKQLNSKRGLGILAGGLVFLGAIGLGLLVAREFFPSFNLERVFAHATDFFNFTGRDLGQVVFQTGKAIIYSSPLLLLVTLVKREEYKNLKLFFWWLAAGGIFYYMLFDFSRGALDKYLAFTIVPISVIGGVVLKRSFSDASTRLNLKWLSGGVVLTAAIFFLQWLPQAVPALYPKGEWIKRILALKWNFLMPFTGGSGPLGFYVSFLFIALLWLLALGLVWLMRSRPPQQRSYLFLLLLISLVYNLTFVQEYALGNINGNATNLVKKAVAFIAANPQIDKVITYNDIGNLELNQIGKYERRIYVAPKNDAEHKQTLNNFKGHYLVVDIPRLSPDSIYARYFSTCQSIYQARHRQISDTVYDCAKAIDLK